MKVCLALFVARGIARPEPGGRYRLLRPDLTRDELARSGQSYRDRQERDLRKHQEMSDYAEGRGCRWQALLNFFGAEGLPGDRCGRCDRCEPKPPASGSAGPTPKPPGGG
jgi:ATP-dependent DNA helicase RecQ